MTTRFITANQGGLSTTNGDYTVLTQGVTMTSGIDMRAGNNGGDQQVFIYGSLFGRLDDYWTDTSGGNEIFIGSTGSINYASWGAIAGGGGGNSITNLGTVASLAGYAIYIVASLSAHQTERTIITNAGTMSGGVLYSTIVVQGGVGTTLTNTGSILSASGIAMQLSGLSDIVINSGFIQGDVAIGSGGWLDTRQGTITGKITAAGGDSTIYGSGLGDTIQTGSGNDVIDGFAGADMMTGGAGDDTYYVDNAGDYIDETGGGDDTVFSFISYDLSDGGAYSGAIERLYLAGSDDLDATGSNKAEKIYGNVGSNLIEGGSGSDTIQGRAGHDVIFGENGNDKILGGSGADVLYGGDGNDGLNGMLGADTMFGGDGDDIYTVDHIGDVVNEQVAGSSGIDKVISSISFNLADTSQAKGQIEDLTLTGGGAINGTGNNLDNEIRGSSGDNIIDGGRGNDKLTGAGGADGFAFTTNLNANSNVDRIKDFVHNTDKILLENSIFTALGAPGALAAGRFAINSPGDANDFIIYDTTTGGLFYDADGNGAGAAVQFARLLGVPGVTQADFEII